MLFEKRLVHDMATGGTTQVDCKVPCVKLTLKIVNPFSFAPLPMSWFEMGALCSECVGACVCKSSNKKLAGDMCRVVIDCKQHTGDALLSKGS